MSEIIGFIKTYLNEIIIIVVVVLFLLVLMNIKGIDLNAPKPPSKLVQQVTVETLSSMGNLADSDNLLRSSSEHFCESYLGDSSNLEKACNDLTETNCGNVKCCVYNNVNNKCDSGDINGPTYKTDKNGKLITMDSYYYMGKKM